MVREQQRATRMVGGRPTRTRRALVRLVCTAKVRVLARRCAHSRDCSGIAAGLDALSRDLPAGLGQNTRTRLTLVMAKQIIAALQGKTEFFHERSQGTGGAAKPYITGIEVSVDDWGT